jgi:hypothetical protein
MSSGAMFTIDDGTMSAEDFASADTAQAWSLADLPEVHDYVEPRHRAELVKVVSVAAVAVLGTIVAAVVMLNSPSHAEATKPTRTPASQSPVASKQADPAPEPGPMDPTALSATAARETPDGQFLQLLRQGNLDWTTPAGAVSDGHRICTWLRQGYSREVLAEQLVAAHSGIPGDPLSLDGARTAVNAAATVYCPEEAR